MALGPGKYDVLCSYVRAQARAQGAIVIIIGGNRGDGFSCQATPQETSKIPDMLDIMARQIRGDAVTLEVVSPMSRLREIADIIERVENRCMAVDGPVPATSKEITEAELLQILKLAKGVP